MASLSKKSAILTMRNQFYTMIINELDFIDDRLYMHPVFLAKQSALILLIKNW